MAKYLISKQNYGIESVVQNKSKFTVFVDGVEMSIGEAAYKSGVSYSTFYGRLRRAAREARPKVGPVITAFGETRTVAEWSRMYGLPYQTITYRIRNGWIPEDAVAGNQLHRGGKQARKESRHEYKR